MIAELTYPDAKLLRRKCPGEVEPLNVVALELRQRVDKLETIDALGYHGHAQSVGKIDERLDDLLIGLVGVELSNKLAIDLDLAGRYALQMGQG